MTVIGDGMLPVRSKASKIETESRHGVTIFMKNVVISQYFAHSIGKNVETQEKRTKERKSRVTQKCPSLLVNVAIHLTYLLTHMIPRPQCTSSHPIFFPHPDPSPHCTIILPSVRPRSAANSVTSCIRMSHHPGTACFTVWKTMGLLKRIMGDVASARRRACRFTGLQLDEFRRAFGPNRQSW